MPIFALHLLFWAPYLVRGRIEARKGPAGPPKDEAPRARALLAFHTSAFALVYLGLGRVVLAGDPPLFPPQRVVGAEVILAGAALSLWTLLVFRSWRVRPEIAADHQLCTDGPFRVVRHPIYLAVNLLALGTFLWAPDVLVALGTVLSCVGGDRRARAEEGLLLAHFGDAYRAYMARTKRFVPGVY